MRSFKSLATGLADRFADDILLERKVTKRDKTGYIIGEGDPLKIRLRGRILSRFEGVGFNDAKKVRGLVLSIPVTCDFSDFCVGDKITILCGPDKGRCYTLAGGNGNSIAQIDGTGAFYEISVVSA